MLRAYRNSPDGLPPAIILYKLGTGGYEEAERFDVNAPQADNNCTDAYYYSGSKRVLIGAGVYKIVVQCSFQGCSNDLDVTTVDEDGHSGSTSSPVNVRHGFL